MHIISITPFFKLHDTCNWVCFPILLCKKIVIMYMMKLGYIIHVNEYVMCTDPLGMINCFCEKDSWRPGR